MKREEGRKKKKERKTARQDKTDRQTWNFNKSVDIVKQTLLSLHYAVKCFLSEEKKLVEKKINECNGLEGEHMQDNFMLVRFL